MQISVKQDFTEEFKNAMSNWEVKESSESDENDRIDAEKDIERRLRAGKKTTAFSIEKFQGRVGPSYALYLCVGVVKILDRDQPIKHAAVVNENYLHVPSLHYFDNSSSLSLIDKGSKIINVRTIEGRPFKLKKLYVERKDAMFRKATLYPL